VDLNGDRKADLVSGSWTGEIYIFEGTGKGRFGERKELVGKHPLPETDRYKRFGYSLLQAASVCAPDWDGDGDIDLVVGTISGHVYLLENEGTKKQHRFGKPSVLVRAKGFAKSGPCVADWDGDGDLDLVVGTESHGVKLYRNTGSRAEPKLATAEDLEPGGERFLKGYRSKPFVTDWNEDGLADLLIGNCEPKKDGERGLRGYVYVCLRQKPEGEGTKK
jgi:hypothetical protein